MSNPKRHHYVPKFYLQGFCNHKNFWIFDRERNVYREQTPTNTTVETQYYSIQQRNGKYDVSLEQKIATIESLTAPVIKKIDNLEPISSYDKYTLSVFVSLLKVRVPEFKKSYEELRTEMLKRLGPMVDRKLDRPVPLPPHPPYNPTEIKSFDAFEIVQNLETLEADAVQAHNHFLDVILPLTAEISDQLYKMQWLIAYAPPDTSFVTSDNPFLVAPPEGYDPYGLEGVGIATPGTTKIIPLSSKSCLLIFDLGEEVVYFKFPRDRVKELNIMIATGCMRYVIARDEALLKNLVKRSGIEKIKRQPKVHSVL